MKIRQLDNNWDWTFGNSNQNYKTGEKAIEQNVKSRLLSFFGDCFFDMEFGINWFQLLGFRGEEQLRQAISNMILTTEGVVAINSVDFYTQNRVLRITYDIQTIYSTSYVASLTNEIN